MEDFGFEFATVLIASYGACIATISLLISIVLTIFEIRRHQPSVKVSARHGRIIDQTRGHSEPLIFMEAINVGSGSITISGVGWLLSDGGKLAFTSPQEISLPIELEEGKRITTYWRCKDFQDYDENQKIKAAYFKDETGKVWKGKIKKRERKLWLNAGDDGWKIY